MSTATKDGSAVRLDAKKSFATSANHADSYVWSSKPTAGSELSTLWLELRAMDDGRRQRLIRLGFEAARAEALSALQTRNFM